MNKKQILIISSSIFLVLFMYLSFQYNQIEKMAVPEEKVNKVFEEIPLTTQKDFKMIGEALYKGSGFEPGFNFKMSLAGKKFGTTLTSQYGDTHYVGFLDLINQSTATKVFAGNMLDKQDKIVTAKFTILNQKCVMPSGEEVPLTVKISVSVEKLSGCAEILK